MIMASEGEQVVVEDDRVADPRDDRRLEVVVEDDPRDAAERLEGVLMMAQEGARRHLEAEAEHHLPRPLQHEREGRELPPRTVHLDLAEVGPVDLRLLADEGRAPQEGLRRLARPMARDHGPKMVLRAFVAALPHHREEAGGLDARVFLERLQDERQVGIDHRGAPHEGLCGDAVASQDPTDRRVVAPELARDRREWPFVRVEVSSNSRLDFF